MLELERLEDRCCPSVSPTVTILGIGEPAQAFVPLVQALMGPDTTLLREAGYTNIGYANPNITTVDLPSNGGTLTEAQIDTQISGLLANGTIPSGPNAMVLVFSDLEPANPIPNAAAWHDGFNWQGNVITTCWSWSQNWWSVPASHEWDEALARMAGYSFEICDPLSNQGVWHVITVAGYNMADFMNPSDTAAAYPPMPFIGVPNQLGPFSMQPPSSAGPKPSPPSLDQLFALGLERLELNIYSLLSHIDPSYAVHARAEAEALRNNPWNNTLPGQVVEEAADELFLSLV